MLLQAGQAVVDYLAGVGTSLIDGVQATLTTFGGSLADFGLKLLGQ